MQTTVSTYTESTEKKFSLTEKRQNESLDSLLALTKELLSGSAVIHDRDFENETEYYWSILYTGEAGETVTVDFSVDFSEEERGAQSIAQQVIVSLDSEYALERIKEALNNN